MSFLVSFRVNDSCASMYVLTVVKIFILGLLLRGPVGGWLPTLRRNTWTSSSCLLPFRRKAHALRNGVTVRLISRFLLRRPSFSSKADFMLFLVENISVRQILLRLVVQLPPFWRYHYTAESYPFAFTSHAV